MTFNLKLGARMMQTTPDPDVLAFISSLARLEKILVEHDQGFWATNISRVRQRAEQSDGYCIYLLLTLYGGMGSLNDLILDAPESVRVEFECEKSRAYGLAKALKKSM